MPPLIPITRVRYTEEQGRALLVTFIFGGKFGGSRAPRGIEPEFVSRFIRENVHADSHPDRFAAVLALLRFYERADVLPHVRQALNWREANGNDVLRSAYVLQAIGDLGSREEAAQGAEYFDRFLTPHRALTSGLYPVLFDTLVALTPAGSPAALFRRLASEVRTLASGQHTSEAGMMQYDTLAAVERNDVPRTNVLIETKKRVIAQPIEARRSELVRIYLGLATGGAILGVWAARLLRKEAMERSPQPVHAEFARQIDAADDSKLGAPRAGAIRVRAAQAILYLQGTLSPRQLARAGDVLSGQGNFLWDE